MALNDYLVARREFFNEELVAFLPAPDTCPEELLSAMKYSLYAGGKRLRPILAFAAAEACGGNAIETLPVAVALEMIHTYSLIHDDLPAMDDDDMRRGKLANHKVFGDGMAILAGDALLTHAFTVLGQMAVDAEKRLALVTELAGAAGPMGMVGGQALDIRVTRVDSGQLSCIHKAKTGALFRASLRMGAIMADAEEKTLDSVSAYADSLGLAYQIIDDILDVTATPETLGKLPGSDLRKDKISFVTVHGLEESRKMAAIETEKAQKVLLGLSGEFQLLVDLAEYISHRTG